MNDTLPEKTCTEATYKWKHILVKTRQSTPCIPVNDMWQSKVVWKQHWGMGTTLESLLAITSPCFSASHTFSLTLSLQFYLQNYRKNSGFIISCLFRACQRTYSGELCLRPVGLMPWCMEVIWTISLPSIHWPPHITEVYSNVCKDCEFAVEYVLNNSLENKYKDLLAQGCRLNPRLCKNIFAFEVYQLQKNLSPCNPNLSANGML